MSLTGILFLLAFSGTCILAFVRHPIYGLLAYLAAFYLSPSDRWWGYGFVADVRWSLLAAGVTAAALLFNAQRVRAVTIPFFKQKPVIGLGLFLAYLLIQSAWAIDSESHSLLIDVYVKLLIAIYFIYRCVDTESNLRIFLWGHVLGCAYLGWLVFTYTGGERFEDFGSPGINEANAGALQMVSGTIVAATLFLDGKTKERIVLLFLIPLLVNAMVATVSRSGFLAIVASGLAFNLATPPRLRRRVMVLSVLAGVLLFMLTNPLYWSRMDTIKYGGEQVAGVDTGGGRPIVMQAQWQMFKAHPMGCGHMCTTALSLDYIDESLWVAGGKASHNTFLTALVDHGIPGAILYLGLLAWVFSSSRTLWRSFSGEESLRQRCIPMLFAFFAAMTIGDMFVQYPRFEARWWFVALTMVLLNIAARDAASEGVSDSRQTIAEPGQRIP